MRLRRVNVIIVLVLVAACLASGGCCCFGDRVHPPQSFKALFNGRNLDGWRGLPADPPVLAQMTTEQRSQAQLAANERMLQHWRIAEDGVLAFDGQGDNLCTIRDYADFELLIDWRIPPGGDSGVYLRGNPQIQIWTEAVGSGGIYNNKRNPSKPLVVADRPVGEWNTFRIKLVGDRATVHLNDVLVVDDVQFENYWERGRQPLPPTGAIELQAHGGPLEFRDIFVHEIERD